jgi:hypothetical protein
LSGRANLWLDGDIDVTLVKKTRKQLGTGSGIEMAGERS